MERISSNRLGRNHCSSWLYFDPPECVGIRFIFLSLSTHRHLANR